LRWLAILRPLVPDLSLAASSGIESGRDVAKALPVGADVAMMTSPLLRRRTEHVGRVESELVAWAAEHEYESIGQLRGSVSHATTADPAAFERANYVRTLHSWVAPAPLTPTAPSRG
jgi:dihydroorotate dehydrogenase (fumarate)